MLKKIITKTRFLQLTAILIFCLFFLSSFKMDAVKVPSLAYAADTAAYLKNVNYNRQIALFKLNKLKHAEIVMLGNSLTHGANWNELLGRNSVVEEGIVGDIVEGFYNRMKYVYKLKPKIVFVLGGLNDIYSWIPVETIFRNYTKIISGLKARRIIPVIQLTTYATEYYAKDWLKDNHPEINVKTYNNGRNTEVDKLNRLLRNYAKVNHIDLIDLNAKTRRGHFLKHEITLDGVHFNYRGYQIWVKEIDKVLKKYKL